MKNILFRNDAGWEKQSFHFAPSEILCFRYYLWLYQLGKQGSHSQRYLRVRNGLH